MTMIYDNQKGKWVAKKWSDLNLETATNMYLFQNPSGPLRRPDLSSVIEMSMDSFMNSGPGRFVRPSDFPIVQSILRSPSVFRSNVFLNLPNGVYTTKELIEEHKIPLEFFQSTLVQAYESPTTEDYVQRAYVYGFTGYVLSDDTKFELSGLNSRVISGEIRAFDDNSDFVSSSIPTHMPNVILIDKVDPDRTGARFEIEYRGNGKRFSDYTLSDYRGDVTKAARSRLSLLEVPFEFFEKVVPAVDGFMDSLPNHRTLRPGSPEDPVQPDIRGRIGRGDKNREALLRNPPRDPADQRQSSPKSRAKTRQLALGAGVASPQGPRVGQSFNSSQRLPAPLGQAPLSRAGGPSHASKGLGEGRRPGSTLLTGGSGMGRTNQTQERSAGPRAFGHAGTIRASREHARGKAADPSASGRLADPGRGMAGPRSFLPVKPGRTPGPSEISPGWDAAGRC